MKHILKTLVILSIIAAIPLTAVAQEGGLRYSITVSKFENKAGWHGQWDIGSAWGTVMTDLLMQTGKFIVLGETDMRQEALAEQDFAASGRTAGGNKAPATGQMTPAQLLVKGAITHVQDDTAGGGGGVSFGGIRVGGKGAKSEINATIYIVDSTTGQVVASESIVATSKEKGMSFGYTGHGLSTDAGGFKNDNVGKAVEAGCSMAVDFLLAELPNIQWTGSVVLNKDGKVYVNRGEREGVAVGQQFTVGDVEVIRDPDTGEILDEDMTILATLTVDTVKEKLSICSVSGGDAAAVEKGMTIHLP